MTSIFGDLWDKQFSGALKAFEQAFTADLPQALDAIFETYGHLDIYAIALYHNGDYTGYITLSVSFEEGLEDSAKGYMTHGTLALEDQKTALRWSPCDSPLHDLSRTIKIDKAESALEVVNTLISDAYTRGWSELELDDDLLDDWSYKAHERVHDIYNRVLNIMAEREDV